MENKKLLLIRKIGRFFIRKHYWILSDRPAQAGDNAEALFCYLQKKKDIVPVFVIQKDSDDYERMKNIGKVVCPWSKEHKFLLCIADVSLTSHLHYFEKAHTETPLVFLQHGVAENDISSYLNPFFSRKHVHYFLDIV